MDHPLRLEGQRILDYLSDRYPEIRQDRQVLEEALLYQEDIDSDRCWAKVKGGQARCSRRRQHERLFCGNHMRSRPYGCMDEANRIATWVDPQFGEDYLIDAEGNVYSNTSDPQKIGSITDHAIVLDTQD